MFLAHHSERGDESLIAIIDGGIDILHEAFLDNNNNSRIIAIWDQTDNSDPERSPMIPDIRQPYGREYNQIEISEYINRRYSGNLSRYQNKYIHGTHVASIAAGKRHRCNEDDFQGIAPDSKIIVVIPETRHERVTDLTSNQNRNGFDAGILNAIKYIISKQEGMPVAINISLGKDLGAHDGSSSIEKYIDQITQTPGLIVIKSAGNNRDKKAHAELIMSNGTNQELKWTTKESNKRNKDEIQLWFQQSSPNNSISLSFRLVHPNGREWSDWITSDILYTKYRFSTGDSCQISYNPSGNSYLTITIMPASHNSIIEVGTWKLEISNECTDNIHIHAWIERTEKSQTEFIDQYVSEKTTLTIPGTARNVISVGSVNSIQESELELCNDSSLGPTRSREYNQPIVVALGENVKGANAGNNGICTSRGTSMAAPQVTGAIALLLSARKKQCDSRDGITQFTAAEIQNMIRSSSSNLGSWQCDSGYGLINISGLLQLLDSSY
jgi:subtilisin family serine protease